MGLGAILIKNAAMFFKCWWQFAVEDKPLWKKIICSCYDWKMNRHVLDQINANLGGVWGAICSVWQINKEVEAVVKNGLWVMVGKLSFRKINGSGMIVS